MTSQRICGCKTCTVPILPTLAPSLAQIELLARLYASKAPANELVRSWGHNGEQTLIDVTLHIFIPASINSKHGEMYSNEIPVPDCHKSSLSLVEVDYVC